MVHIKLDEIKGWERSYRANFINSITGFKAVNLIGTCNEKGINNLAIFSSVLHLGADPALVGFIQRPITETSHTYKNILANKKFTINHVQENFVEQAHYTSAKFHEEESEFEKCGLTAQMKEEFEAPFVAESQVKIGLVLVEIIPIKHNNTFIVIGAIEHVILNEEFLSIDGNIQLDKAKSIAVAGLENYYSASHLSQFGYAKSNNLPSWSKKT